MASATQIKVGNTVIFNGELCRITKLTHITPGKGNAVVQAEMRNLGSGSKMQNRFRSSENVEVASLQTRGMQYLYESEGIFFFMDMENYEQYEVGSTLLGDDVQFLVPETKYIVDLYEGKPIGLELPPRLTFKILQTDPAEKGSAGKTKPATLEGGLVVHVPLFLATGEAIVINTETREYVERA